MLLEPNPFVKTEHAYYSKASPPTEQLKDAQSAQDQPQPPATPTPSAAIDPTKYESASRRPPAQTMTSLKIPIPRRAEPPSPDMTRPPHPSAIPAPGHAQAALRRPTVPIVPKPSTTTHRKGFHVVRYEVRQERYQLHPSAKPGARTSANHNGPPSSAGGPLSSSGESDDSSDGSGSETDNSDDSDDSDDDDDDSETDAPAAVHEADLKKKATTSTKRKRVSRPEGLVKVKEEAGSSFMDKNAHIKRPRNAWIHVSYLDDNSLHQSFSIAFPLSLCSPLHSVYAIDLVIVANSNSFLTFTVQMPLWSSFESPRPYTSHRGYIKVSNLFSLIPAVRFFCLFCFISNATCPACHHAHSLDGHPDDGPN